MKTFLKYTFPILTIIILVLAVWLSHQPGDISGRESAHLAQLLGVTDVFLRSACHYMFFFLITFCCGVSLVLWEKPLWWLLLMLPLCWLDEASKPMIIGRHFSWVDVGKNAAGAGAGMLLTIVVWVLHNQVIQRKRSGVVYKMMRNDIRLHGNMYYTRR